MVNFNFDDAECGLTPQTMAVLAEYNELGKIYTRVLEKDNEFTIPKAPREVIDNACRYFGSSLESCQEGTREICDFSHKTPIVINLYCGMFFFPDRKSTRLNSSHVSMSYAVFCLKKIIYT